MLSYYQLIGKLRCNTWIYPFCIACKGVNKLDTFNEQVVKRAKKPKNLIAKIVAVFLLIAVPALCIILAPIIKVMYLIYVAFFIFIAGIYVVWYVFSIQKVEFEYSVLGDDLNISKIIALRKRKKICKVPIREIAMIEKSEKKIENMHFMKTFVAARDVDAKDENYYVVYNSVAYGKCLLVFSPNEQILQGMKPYLNKDIVLKLFYKRNTD